MKSAIHPSRVKVGLPLANACAMIESFEKKPAVKGKPARQRQPIRKVQLITPKPFTLRSPDILRRSSWPAMPCMIAPQHRKSSALKKAWVNTWYTAPKVVPTPRPRNM